MISALVTSAESGHLNLRMLVLLAALLGLLTGPAFACPGDCDDSRSVSVDEIVRAVQLALGESDTNECAAADADGDARVTVSDILAAVYAALAGCDAVVIPTVTPTPATRPELEFVELYGSSLAFSCEQDERKPDFHVCIRNSGEADAGPFAVTVGTPYFPEQGPASWDIPGLRAGVRICLAAPLFDSVTVRIDPTAMVAEKDESNNQRPYYLPTLTRGPGCTPTPTPTGRASCCETAAGCSGETGRLDCFNQGGYAFEAPATCGIITARCGSVPFESPSATVTPSVRAPDLIPVSVRHAPWGIGGHLCPSPGCLLACVRNGGEATSPPFEMSIGSYWRRQVGSLPALDHICVLAPYPARGRGRLEIDAPGAIGESDETNNTLDFTVPARESLSSSIKTAE